MSDHQLRRRVQSGFLEQTGPHSFRLPGAATGPAADLRALVLDIGEPCWVSGPTAAALHGFDGFVLRRPFHLSVLRDRNVRRIGAIVHTTADLPSIDRESHDGIPVTSPTRTIIDLARTEPPSRLTAAVDSALRDGLTSDELLHRRINALRARGRFGVPALLDVLGGREITRGGHSWLERESPSGRESSLGGNRPGFRDGSRPDRRGNGVTPIPRRVRPVRREEVSGEPGAADHAQIRRAASVKPEIIPLSRALGPTRSRFHRAAGAVLTGSDLCRLRRRHVRSKPV